MLISNAIVCDESGERNVDVRIEEGFIVEIGEGLVDQETIDAKGAYLLPSLIDTNVRLQDATLNAKNIQAISNQAKEGGVGHVILNADSIPAIDNEVVLEFAQNATAHLSGAQVDLMLNTLNEEMTLSNIAILLKKGVIAPYMSTFAKNDLAIRIAQYVQMYKVTLFCKAEDNSLKNAGVMLDGDICSQLGLAGIPDLSEVLHVSRMIEIARHFKISILFKAIASPRSVELISKAKQEGVAVQCEVSIHHLLNSDETCIGFNTTAKLDPPLASKEDVLELQAALKDGKIDVLTSLHQPSSPVNKEVAFYDAAYGCEALKDALPLYYTKFVKSGMISMQDLVRLTVSKPAKTIGLKSKKIEIGVKANLVLLDVSQSYEVKNQQSLYNGETLFGKVKAIF